MEAALIIATMYAGPFVGQPLYCSTPDHPLTYSPSTPLWIALPVEDYESGKVRCGDLMFIRFHLPDGTTTTLLARAYDAGPFASYCVMQLDGSCPSIAADVPVYFWPGEGISVWAEVIDLTAEAEKRGMRVH